MSRRVAAVLTMLLGLVMLAPLLTTQPALGVDSEGECPAGYTKISSGFSGLSWVADADYSVVILVGGPPDPAQNQDPDGRDKTFFNVQEGDTISRVAHDISHICVFNETTTTEASTTSTTETPPTTVNDEPTTTTTEGSTTTTEQGATTTTTEGSTTTSEGGTTSTGIGSTTAPPTLPSTTLVEVNPICVDCNNATVADLQQLNGITETLALAIIANRPYETLQDLVTKQVLTPGQLLLIVVLNQGTQAFASDACLNAVGVTTTTAAGGTTTTAAGVTSTGGTLPGNLPFTGQDSVPIAAAASGIMGIGLMILGWTMRKERA